MPIDWVAGLTVVLLGVGVVVFRARRLARWAAVNPNALNRLLAAQGMLALVVLFVPFGFDHPSPEGDKCDCDDPGLVGFLIGAPAGAVIGAIVGVKLF